MPSRSVSVSRRFLWALLLSALSMIGVAGAAARAADEPILHVVLAVDLKAEGLEKQLALDLESLRALFNLNVRDDHLNLVETPDRPTGLGVLGLFAQGRVGGKDVAPEDAIVFIYDGHGSFDPDRRDAALDLSSGEILFLGDVVKAVQTCKPRLAVIINIACADFRKNPQINFQKEIRRYSTVKSQVAFSPLFTKLFVEPRGMVMLSASAPGQFAASYPGEPTSDGNDLIYRGTIFGQNFAAELQPFGRIASVAESTGPGVARPSLPPLAEPPGWPELVERLKQAVAQDYEFYIRRFNKVPGQATQTVAAVLDLGGGSTIPRWGVTVTPVPNGLKLLAVASGSWAAAANLRVGDVVVGISTAELDTPADLRAVLGGLSDDDLFRIVGFRADGQSFEFTRRLRDGVVAAAPPRRLGAATEIATGGLRLTSVEAGSLAALLKLKAGDVLVSLNGRPTQKPSDLEMALAATKSDAKVSIEVIDAASGQLRSDKIVTIIQ
jgi:membrane-associated protease RseP (regulator of RpoE activity)